MARQAALITGGAKRIGSAIAVALAREGFDIALHYRSSLAEAESLKRELEELGVECELFQADFEADFDALALMERVKRRFAGLAVLVNNVSVFEPGKLLETDPSLFDRVFRVNLRAPFFLTRAFALRCESGLVVNILDARVASNPIEHFAYTLSKKALRDFTQMAALELSPRIRVNAVCPGVILAPRGAGPEYLERRAKAIPAGRHGDPEDVARAVVFFVQNPFVTGQEIFVDGGEHLL